ncbi:hypothetical protein [Halioxenophilus sp. WMMB6]|uniref:hypothetical protein n=1 Tax=Halioxenophilus sp. WMMB6 TaxID=3073815 RepID=UPI00295F1BC1|nr:hypothetical protein [Halioxenophilus sp. WMMB6]
MIRLIQPLQKVIGTWLACCIGLTAVSVFAYQLSVRHQVAETIADWLPGRIAEAKLDYYAGDNPEALFIQRTNQDLSQYLSRPNLQVYLLALYDTDSRPWWPLSAKLTVTWQSSDNQYRSLLAVQSLSPWRRIGLQSALLALPLSLLLLIAPRPISRQRGYWLEQLSQNATGLFAALKLTRNIRALPPEQDDCLRRLWQAHAVTIDRLQPLLQSPVFGQLSPEQLAWFELALSDNHGNLESALDVAQSEPGVQLKPQENQLWIHGLLIPLTKTPYCYYLWYAQRRRLNRDGGWVMNPPANRPDTELGEELQQLMSQYQGHRKALNELQQHGLRAKTVDQNRNKIKEEMVQLLGEKLAADYLFETERDFKTGRSRYRLAPGESRIIIHWPPPEK